MHPDYPIQLNKRQWNNKFSFKIQVENGDIWFHLQWIAPGLINYTLVAIMALLDAFEMNA